MQSTRKKFPWQLMQMQPTPRQSDKQPMNVQAAVPSLQSAVQAMQTSLMLLCDPYK